MTITNVAMKKEAETMTEEIDSIFSQLRTMNSELQTKVEFNILKERVDGLTALESMNVILDVLLPKL